MHVSLTLPMKDVKLNGGSHDSLIVNENAQIYALSILKVGFFHLILLQRQLSHHKIEYTIKNVQSSLLCGTGTHTSLTVRSQTVIMWTFLHKKFCDSSGQSRTVCLAHNRMAFPWEAILQILHSP